MLQSSVCFLVLEFMHSSLHKSWLSSVMEGIRCTTAPSLRTVWTLLFPCLLIKRKQFLNLDICMNSCSFLCKLALHCLIYLLTVTATRFSHLLMLLLVYDMYKWF